MPSGADNGCFVFSQLNHPSNIDEDDISHYVLGHQMGNVTVTGTSSDFRVPSCTDDLEIKVSAVNRCGALGNSTVASASLLPDMENLQDEGT